MKRLRWWAGLPTALLAAALWVDGDLTWKLADWLTERTHAIRGHRP